jgi:hypothetical protein
LKDICTSVLSEGKGRGEKTHVGLVERQARRAFRKVVEELLDLMIYETRFNNPTFSLAH